MFQKDGRIIGEILARSLGVKGPMGSISTSLSIVARHSSNKLDDGSLAGEYKLSMQCYLHMDVSAARVLFLNLTPDADAYFGLDDLREWCVRQRRAIPIYLDQPTYEIIARSFPYLVDAGQASGGGDV